MTQGGFRFTLSHSQSDWLSLNTLSLVSFSNFKTPNLSSVGKNHTALFSLVVHHPIIANLHQKKQKMLLLTMHRAGGNPTLFTTTLLVLQH